VNSRPREIYSSVSHSQKPIIFLFSVLYARTVWNLLVDL
jgi:hypothetical protein